MNDKDTFQTPAELYDEAVKLLKTTIDEKDIQAFNTKARLSILKFYTIAPELPEIHLSSNETITDFQIIMKWYVRSKEYIESLPCAMDGSILDEIIKLLEELKALSLFDVYSDGVIKEKIHKKAQKDMEACQKLIEGKKRRDIRDYAQRSGVGVLKFSKKPEDYFLRVAENLYRTLDKEYAEALEKVQSNIHRIGDKINKYFSTPTGKLLDQYDILGGLNLQGRFDTFGLYYSTEMIVNSGLFGEEYNRESLIESIIFTFREIKRHGQKEN